MDCADGQYCASGTCRTDTRPRPDCSSDADCRFACINGVCRTPCETTEECARVDVQFSFCLESYCATTNEVTSNCATSRECDPGDECIDGVCR